MQRLRYWAMSAVIGVCLLAASGGYAQTPGWAVGNWAGRIEGFPGGRDGPDRILIVAPDGKCRWGLPRDQTPAAAKSCKISGQSLSLVTSADTTVELAFVGGKLQGTFALAKGSSGTYPITLAKQ